MAVTNNPFEKRMFCFKPKCPQVNQRTKAADKMGIVFNKVVLGLKFFIRIGLFEQLSMTRNLRFQTA